MTPTAFTAPGRFYRGNLHTHSDVTDGTLPPEEVCRRYKARGYDFIALTDHFVGVWDYPIVDTVPFRDETFTTILGAELHSGAQSNGELWHLLAVGLPADFTPSNSPDFTARSDQETGPQIAARARASGAFVSIAHPHWSGLTMQDALSIEAAHCVEIYNHGAHTLADRGTGLPLLDALLNDGRRLTLIATDDAHFKGPDAFGGWVMVKATENSPEALLQSLKDGQFYSSQGPDIHDITVEEGAVNVSCSAATTVIVQAAGNASDVAYGASMTRAQIPLGRMAQSPWLRVTVIDAAGHRAWSNPIWQHEV